jgi:L-2,4-diaminobutyrate decarboxylase
MLDYNEKMLEEAGRHVLAALASYVKESQDGSAPVVHLESIEDLSDSLGLDVYLREGGMGVKELQVFLQKYLAHSMRMHHPGYMGHQVAVPHLGSALADLIHGVVGNPMSIYEMGPSAATTEQAVINWMLEKVGWGEQAGGVLTNGGSIANLHGMLAARAHIAPEAWAKGNPPDLVVLSPENAHYCVGRAISMMGLGRDALISIPTDHNEMIIAQELEALIHRQRAKGKRIMAVVANGCATSTGLYDPIEDISAICRKENVWFHLDSPHGATALLSIKYRHYLKGIENADSVVWDAHKMMRTGSLCTGILFRDKTSMKNTFSQEASYLFHEKENPGTDTLAYQIECTKSAIGTRLFLVLAMMGEKGLGTFVAKLYDRARSFAQMINQRPGFTSPFPLHSNIVCFQYKPDEYDQLKLRNQLVKTEKFYISSTEIRGIRYLRIVLMHLETSTSTFTAMLDEIEKTAKKIIPKSTEIAS